MPFFANLYLFPTCCQRKEKSKTLVAKPISSTIDTLFHLNGKFTAPTWLRSPSRNGLAGRYYFSGAA